LELGVGGRGARWWELAKAHWHAIRTGLLEGSMAETVDRPVVPTRHLLDVDAYYKMAGVDSSIERLTSGAIWPSFVAGITIDVQVLLA
jgi:hypothetical protein